MASVPFIVQSIPPRFYTRLNEKERRDPNLPET